MERVAQDEHGAFRWSCRIDREQNQKAALKGAAACAVIAAVVLLICLMMPAPEGTEKPLWLPLIPLGVILLIAVPLLFMQYTASDPHEQYLMDDSEVKSGYGKSAVLTEFRKTESVTVTSGYLELSDGRCTNRIYVPPEDMDLVREHILKRIPEHAVIIDQQGRQ